MALQEVCTRGPSCARISHCRVQCGVLAVKTFMLTCWLRLVQTSVSCSSHDAVLNQQSMFSSKCPVPAVQLSLGCCHIFDFMDSRKLVLAHKMCIGFKPQAPTPCFRGAAAAWLS